MRLAYSSTYSIPFMYSSKYPESNCFTSNSRSSGRSTSFLAGHSSMEQPLPVGLTEIPVRSSSGAHLGSSGYIPTRAESVTPMYLAPETYLSERDSPDTWSSASIDPVCTTAHTTTSASTSAPSTTPFMHPYYDFVPSQPSMSMPQQFPLSGYTPQQINKWCMDSDFRGFYQPPSIPQSRPTSYPAGMQPQNSIYPLRDAQDVDVHTSWFQPIFNSSAPYSMSSSQSQELYLSPSYPGTTASTSSVMSNSPAPTSISDFDTPLSSAGTRHTSPSSTTDLSRYGIPTGEGAWRCAHPGCTSQAIFRRGCDLRKHFNRHRKHLFCRREGCPQSQQGGFSSKKDRARHEAKHNPGIVCEWDGCGRVFSRVDNMKDHVRRIHRRGQ